MSTEYRIPWLGLLLIVAILGLVWVLAMPAISVGGGYGMQTQMLSNMKQLQLATQQMALDGLPATNAPSAWPGDSDCSVATWAANLVRGKYLTTPELVRLLDDTTHDPHGWSLQALSRACFPPPATLPTANTNAILLYAVSGTSPGDTVFLSSGNFTNTPTGGLPPSPHGWPFGTKGFVIFHKAGDGLILANRQAGQTNLIGAYAPLCK